MNLSTSVLDANKPAPSKTANEMLFPTNLYYAFSYIYIYIYIHIYIYMNIYDAAV